MENNSETNFFGLTTFRNQRRKFGIKTDDRRRHFYCIGKTGMGKSNMMENMAIQDIQEGRGIAYVDPHGEGAEKLLDFIPTNRINDVIFFNPADLDYPIAFNVMEKVDFRYRHLVAGGLMGVFKKVWPDVWSARMEYILNNTILALLEYPDSTLLGINRMLADVEYRQKVVEKVTDPIVRSFWVTEYARYTQRYEIEATAAIQNKVGQFVSNALIRNIIGQTKSTINMRDIMDTKRIFIMDLSKGRIGEDNSRLLGALLITKLQLAAMSRVDIPEDDREDFYLYVDEFQNFATESFANILSEARKYRLNIVLGHQYITQMEEEVRDAVFGNVGTLAIFRIGAEDAEFLEREFSPTFTAEDLVNLPKYNIYLKLMIDGIASHPFSAETLPPPIPLENSNREKIVNASRDRYGVKKEIVEDKISRWSGFGEEEKSEVLHVAPVRTGQQDKKQGQSNDKPKISQNTAPMQKSDLPPVGHLQQDGQTTLYDAICSNCGKPTKVVFPPEKGRAVYCKSCLKKIKSTEGGVALGAQQFNRARVGQQDNKTQTQNAARQELFGPSSEILLSEREKNKDNTKNRSEIKIENIPFHNPKNRPEEQKHDRPKRKEISLSELRKALEDSLKIKEEVGVSENEDLETRIEEEKEMDSSLADPEQQEKEIIKKENNSNPAKDEVQKTSEKISEAIKTLPPEPKSNSAVEPSDSSETKKKIIKPGETVKF